MAKVIVLGAGVDSSIRIGMPLTNELIPKISDFITSEYGTLIDEKLRKLFPQLRFRFDNFIKTTIDNFAQDFSSEIDSIRTNVNNELQNNLELDEEQRKMGRLIVAIMEKVTAMKTGATLDEETETLIREVFATDVTDDTIIDFSKVVYTDTFKSVLRMILERSLSNSTNPILRHVYHNLLDIEDLLMRYFIGFYTGKEIQMKTYSYITWALWVYLVNREKEITVASGENFNTLPVYSQLQSDNIVITFNYTSFAYLFTKDSPQPALYFHGCLMDYVDVYNKTEMRFSDRDYMALNIENFITEQLSQNICFNEEQGRKYTIPSLLPPVKIKPVLSKRYIDTWYKATQAMLQADKIIIIGYSFNNSDEHFNGILRECISKPVVIVDTDIDGIICRLSPIFRCYPNQFTVITIQGKPAKLFGLLTIIQSPADEIDIRLL